ncbi:MAG: ferredoxin [bacterium]|nr:ferredoxin [bacterium]
MNPPQNSLKLQPLVWIDQESCVQCGNCSNSLPQVFGADDDGTAFVHRPSGASPELIQQAMDQCSGSCIHWQQTPLSDANQP